jgi:hypothetical protein
VNEVVPFNVLPMNKAPFPVHEIGVFMKALPVIPPVPPANVSELVISVLDARFSGDVEETITGVFKMVTPVMVGVAVPDAIILSRLPIVEPACPTTAPATLSLTGALAQVPPLLLVIVRPEGTVKF